MLRRSFCIAKINVEKYARDLGEKLRMRMASLTPFVQDRIFTSTHLQWQLESTSVYTVDDECNVDGMGSSVDIPSIFDGILLMAAPKKKVCIKHTPMKTTFCC